MDWGISAYSSCLMYLLFLLSTTNTAISFTPVLFAPVYVLQLHKHLYPADLDGHYTSLDASWLVDTDYAIGGVVYFDDLVSMVGLGSAKM
ncbi:hypothetical protein FIBSPDRAFT_373003, partial [Athelia psychrophila]